MPFNFRETPNGTQIITTPDFELLGLLGGSSTKFEAYNSLLEKLLIGEILALRRRGITDRIAITREVGDIFNKLQARALKALREDRKFDITKLFSTEQISGVNDDVQIHQPNVDISQTQATSRKKILDQYRHLFLKTIPTR
jgi:hypothetical protein